MEEGGEEEEEEARAAGRRTRRGRSSDVSMIVPFPSVINIHRAIKEQEEEKAESHNFLVKFNRKLVRGRRRKRQCANSWQCAFQCPDSPEPNSKMVQLCNLRHMSTLIPML